MRRFFRWYCRKDMVDAIEGDLLELYRRRVFSLGKTRANLLYLLNVIMFFQPFALKRKSKTYAKLTTIDMLRNYLLIAIRTIKKTKSIAAINIIGMAIGISSFMMMVSYVVTELSYDKFHKNADRIVRLNYSYETRGETSTVSRVSFPLKHRLLEKYPEVEKVARFYINRMDASTLKYDDKSFTEEKIYFSDPEVFEIFDFPLAQGDPSTALIAKNSIVLSQAMAKKYFGDENPIGKSLLYKNSDQLQVTGIFKKSFRSHLDFDFLVPVELQRQRWKGDGSNKGYDLEEDWRWSGSWTYVLLKDAFLKNDFDIRLLEDGTDLFGRVDNPSVDFNYQSQQLADIHLYSNMISEISSNGSISQVYAFAAVAILILLIACINFVNLTTAQSVNRAKEIGLRKVMGAHRKHLIGQFITESTVITLLSTALGLLLLELLIPLFNSFLDQDVSIPYIQVPILMILIFFGALIVGGLAGFYPSFYLSRLKPVKVLKGKLIDSRSNFSLRKVLVITQFIVSNTLIIGILAIQMQMDYIKGKDLGFDKDQVIILDHGSKIDDEFKLFKSKLINNPRISQLNLGYVAGTSGWQQSFRVEGEAISEAKSLGFKHISHDFMDMFNTELVAGRNFSNEFPTDSSSAVMLNEAAVKTFGWSNAEALGKRFSWVGGSDNKTRFETKVIGVMKDANFESLYQPVRPSVFTLSNFGDVSIKFNVGDRKELLLAIDEVEQVWNELAPSWPFEFTFLDQQIEAQYQKEEKLGMMIQFFAFLAIFIACMGLFGLATFTVKTKLKEIGIRKVLGARLAEIVFGIMKGFLALVVVSFVISVPVGYFLSDSWLQDFAYRIDLSPFIFLIAGIASLLVAGLTILSQSLNAAKTDPAKTLRYE
ncbi:MAG: ABC transporter permease [Ekhidna sp.]